MGDFVRIIRAISSGCGGRFRPDNVVMVGDFVRIFGFVLFFSVMVGDFVRIFSVKKRYFSFFAICIAYSAISVMPMIIL